MKKKYLADLPRTTLSDYPGKSAAILFFQGCNMRCPFCHNRGILTGPGKVTLDEAIDRLKRMKAVAEGVVLSGGEPTLCPMLETFIDRIREMGLKIKLDTNGTRPEVLKKIAGKVDYIAMDIKSDKEHYKMVSGNWSDIHTIKASCDIIMDLGVPHEFRTTVVPGYDSVELLSRLYDEFGIEKSLSYVLQRYLPVEGYIQREHTQEEWDVIVRILGSHRNVSERGYF